MKKQYIFLLLLLSSISLSAQVEKGKWCLSGSSSFALDIGKEKWQSSGDGTTTSEYKYTEFDFMPEAGYFVIDQLLAGLFIDYEYYKDVAQDDNDTWKSSTFVIGPFVKYYIMDYKKIWPYAAAGIGFGSEKETYEYEGIDPDEEKWKYMSYRLGGGATYFISDNVGFDLFLGYNHNTTTYENTEAVKSTSSEDSKDLNGSFRMSFGIVVTIGK